MKFTYKMETILYAIIVILCTIMFLNLFYALRNVLRYRVNCWFCNKNFWVKFIERNSWTCPECEQYNGFTKDGDYNKPITTASEKVTKSCNMYQRSPPRNGLCKMCNINQQLKVTQLSNFVPMNEKKYDEEIESYRMQLEKAYKLCSPCRKVVQTKLIREKEILLDSKFLGNRNHSKKIKNADKKLKPLRNIINNTSKFIAMILILMITIECTSSIQKNKLLLNKLTNVKDIFIEFFDRLARIAKMKLIMTFPTMKEYIPDLVHTSTLNNIPKYNFRETDNINALTQKVLGGFVCVIQILGHIWSINKLKHAVVIDLVWSIFLVSSLAPRRGELPLSIIKMIAMLVVVIVYKNINNKTSQKTNLYANTTKLGSPSRRNFSIDEEDSSIETDDDVSLSEYGLPNFTDSSNEMLSPHNSSHNNGRSFTPRINDSIWTKPKLNSTFCVNSVLSKSPSSSSETVFGKPAFRKYQNLTKNDSDSELDESISTLCIGSPTKSKHNNSIFSLRKFTASPNFVVPTPMTRARPLISPSKLGHSTSWVAGGYWGSDGERQIINIDGSRSSSQSSGFESQASSMAQRNVFSQPSSREESVCGEPDRASLVFDHFQNNCKNNNNVSAQQTFSGIGSPVFPQMQYNSHVHIPQPRMAQQNNAGPNVFAQQQSFAQNNMFKAPNRGLFKLPQANSFTSR